MKNAYLYKKQIIIPALVLLTLNVAAQTKVLQEVTVKGNTAAKQAKENPIPVMIVSPKKIDSAIESNIIDVLVKNVPGLNAVKTGPNISKPFIRGLGYNWLHKLYNGIRGEGK